MSIFHCHSNLNIFLVNGVISNDANASLIPSLSLTMKGNSHFTINDPIIVISTEVILSVYFFLYCSVSSSTKSVICVLILLESLHFLRANLYIAWPLSKALNSTLLGVRSVFLPINHGTSAK